MGLSIIMLFVVFTRLAFVIHGDLLRPLNGQTLMQTPTGIIL